MERVFEFIINNPLNVFVFAMMVTLLIVTEMRRLGKAWTAQQLVPIINGDNAVVLDLRNEKDFAHGHIIDSINLPSTSIEDLEAAMQKHQSKEVVLVCANGRQSASAQSRLKGKGYKTSRLNGGLIEWSVANLPLHKS